MVGVVREKKFNPSFEGNMTILTKKLELSCVFIINPYKKEPVGTWKLENGINFGSKLFHIGCNVTVV